MPRRLRRSVGGLATVVGLLGVGLDVAAAHPFLSNYRWVDPPEDAPVTEAPLARTLEIPASPSAVLPTEVWTGDLQAVLDLVESPLPTDADRTAVVAALTPHAAGSLGSLPRDLFPAGNAYEVRVSETAGAPVPVDAPGRVLLATAHPEARVLFSPDGEAWRDAPVEEVIPTQVTATFAASGYYVPVVDHDPGGGAGTGTGTGGGAPVFIVAIALTAAFALWYGASHLRRR